MIEPIFDLLTGLILAYVFIRVARGAERSVELRWYAGGLVIAAGVYVAFGLVLGGKPLGFELVQLAVFVGIAVAGVRYSPLILAGGWLLHAGWDTVHFHPTLSQHAPEWYVLACLSFDVALAAYIVIRRRRFDPAPDPSLPTVQPLNQE